MTALRLMASSRRSNPETLTRNPSQRRFYLLDAVILLLAVAVGFAITIAQVAQIASKLRLATLDSSFSVANYGTAQQLAYGMILSVRPMLLLLTLTVPILRLRRPRPQLQTTMRQPGVTACAAVLVAFFVKLLFSLSLYAIVRAVPTEYARFIPGKDWTSEFDAWTSGAGEVVVAAWIILALGRALRLDGDWVDRLGRLLAFCWVLCLFSGIASYWFASLLFYDTVRLEN